MPGFPTVALKFRLFVASTTMKFSLSEITELIRHRRSIAPKDYSDRSVHKEMVERILTNATWAPTHGLTQPWRFTVYTGEGRERLSRFLGEEYTRMTPPEKFLQKKYDNITQRPLMSSVVIALGLERDPNGKISERDEVMAVACAVQNMYLTCTAYGLGAFWATGGPLIGDGMRGFQGLTPAGQSLGLFFVGYPAGEWPKSHRRPVEMVCNWEEK